MYREQMPRVYELQDLISDRSVSDAYFQNFDDTVRVEPEKRKTWLARERCLQRLDPVAWEFLKSEANPYLTSRDTRGRGHQQLISILNQAFAYNYLTEEGCLRVAFIPPSQIKGQETSDLEGELNERKVLCEVKTISISDNEAARRQTGCSGSTSDSLEMGLFNKLTSDLLKAKRQMESYDKSEGIRRIAFVIPNFDDLLGEYKADYFQQIDRHIAANPVSGIDIVFFNQRMAFHLPVSMINAIVVNEQAG
jgi:hypothetical protein